MQKNIKFFRKGKPSKNGKERYIAYSEEGKVILYEKPIKEGYYRIDHMRELEKCIIAEVLTPVDYDYYNYMGYEKFMRLLIERGYKIAFEMPFTRTRKGSLNDSSHVEMRLVAYSKEYNIVIVADTSHDMEWFYSIRCYCYGKDFICPNVDSKTMVMHSNNCIVFELIQVASLTKAPLYFLEGLAYKGKDAEIDLIPPGFTYGDNPISEEDFRMYQKKFYDLCSPELREFLYKTN